jgi:hypothetical protein
MGKALKQIEMRWLRESLSLFAPVRDKGDSPKETT